MPNRQLPFVCPSCRVDMLLSKSTIVFITEQANLQFDVTCETCGRDGIITFPLRDLLAETSQGVEDLLELTDQDHKFLKGLKISISE